MRVLRQHLPTPETKRLLLVQLWSLCKKMRLHDSHTSASLFYHYQAAPGTPAYLATGCERTLPTAMRLFIQASCQNSTCFMLHREHVRNPDFMK